MIAFVYCLLICRFLEWINNCDRLDLEHRTINRVNFRVCCYHFEDKMFVNLNKRRLRLFAVPNIFGVFMCFTCF